MLADDIDQENVIIAEEDSKDALGDGTPWRNRLIIQYTHEKRIESYKRDVHQIWVKHCKRPHYSKKLNSTPSFSHPYRPTRFSFLRVILQIDNC